VVDKTAALRFLVQLNKISQKTAEFTGTESSTSSALLRQP
jgi:hypothetical protein